ncbi:DUF3592 domain-containing protein [Allonocardiopsis opalescens]|uniref:Uncharacterized protein DUF3592 n=1 Tax=Allonocardiopsis opalescens TaxID=1144618 RepID=A0A2T0PXE2_9ACTN|nr:DUF3592 domain-containing protein [Allonocardiopsis opalescens]PRX96202.1 uncharacterized protein DUF3592 [Allonocardiopsis opalescens]
MRLEGALGLILMLGSGLLLAAEVWPRLATLRFRRRARRALGVVVNVHDASQDPGVVFPEYRPVILFRTDDGERVTATSNRATPWYDFEPGEQVEVRYSPDSPNLMQPSERHDDLRALLRLLAVIACVAVVAGCGWVLTFQYLLA